MCHTCRSFGEQPAPPSPRTAANVRVPGRRTEIAKPAYGRLMRVGGGLRLVRKVGLVMSLRRSGICTVLIVLVLVPTAQSVGAASAFASPPFQQQWQKG